MPFDRVIDSLTGDYVDNGDGSLQTTETIQTSIYTQFRIALNRWWGRPESGNAIHELQQLGLVGDINQETIERLLFALQEMIDDGRAADPVFDIEQDQNGKLVVVSSIRDVQKQARVVTKTPIGA